MAYITEEDEKLLKELGLENIPEIDKQVMLEEIDIRMTKRFLANILISLDPDKAQQLEEEVAKIPSQNTEEIISKIIESHPDAAKVLQESAKQIMDELKSNQTSNKGESNMDTNPTDAGAAPAAPQDTPAAPPMDQPATTPADTPADGADNSAALGGLNNAPSNPPIGGTGNDGQNATAPAAEPPAAEAAAPAEGAPAGDAGLPTPQVESANPFGDEIKIVKDEEPAPAAAAEPPAPADTSQAGSTDSFGASNMPTAEPAVPETPPVAEPPATETPAPAAPPAPPAPQQ